jgi:hypothetical protein
MYSDNPSMDEILRRIKRALADRNSVAEATPGPREAALSAQPAPVSMREYAKSPIVSKKILDGLVEDFSVSQFSVRPAKKSPPPPAPVPAEPPRHDGRVVVLTRKMRAVKRPDLSRADLDRFYASLASSLATGMSISYMADRIEKWLRENMADIAAKSSA